MTAQKRPKLYYALDTAGTTQTLPQAQKLLNAVGHHLVHHDVHPQHGTTLQLVDEDGTARTLQFTTRLHKTPLAKAREIYDSRIRVLEISLVD